MIRVDQDVDPIRRRAGIAPGEEADDAIGIGIVGVHAHVDRRSVERHPRFGAHRPGCSLERLALNEGGDRGGLRPGGIAQVAIENDGKAAFADRDGGHLRDRLLRQDRCPQAHHGHCDDCESEPSGHASPQQHKTPADTDWLTTNGRSPGLGLLRRGRPHRRRGRCAMHRRFPLRDDVSDQVCGQQRV